MTTSRLAILIGACLLFCLPTDGARGQGWRESFETADPSWRLEEHGYQPALEHDVETRFGVSNGVVGVRGSLVSPTAASRPRTLGVVKEQVPESRDWEPGQG